MPNKLREVAEKKTSVLSKILRIDSNSYGPDTHIIEKMQVRLNNPLFKLSFSDYELMCGNIMLTKMMSKVLDCEVKQLKKFCKYINVFKENLNSSPKSIKNKMKGLKKSKTMPIKNRGSLDLLPEDLLYEIVDKYISLFPTKYVLRSWIPVDKLLWFYLSQNPNALEMLKERARDENNMSETELNDLDEHNKLDWKYLSSSSNAIDLLKQNMDKIDWELLSTNSNAIELLKANPNKIYWESLSYNRNPQAIKLLEENLTKLTNECWRNLSKNPSAIKLLNANKDKIHWELLSENPNAIEILKENRDKIKWYYLSRNPNAIELLNKRIKEEDKFTDEDFDNLDEDDIIDWRYLSKNPNAIELLKKNFDKIYWVNLSANPNAIELLRENQVKIDWRYLSGNPNAIELLRENPNKINWRYLSGNQNAIELLKENPDNIDWNFLSSNPSIFEAK